VRITWIIECPVFGARRYKRATMVLCGRLRFDTSTALAHYTAR
jgi:hypothetical protein